MIIVKIIGGMGNQLFQYAAGRRLALHHNVPLKLDVSGFATYTWHIYSLKPFALEATQEATPEEIDRANPAGRKGLSGKVSRLCRKLRLPQNKVFWEAKVRPYDVGFLKAGPNTYLDGYWQCEKYFLDIADDIRREFTIKVPQDDASRKVADEIKTVNAVSLHVRRGNYVSLPEVNRVHGTCSIEYYQECIAQIAQKVKDPRFFVFSDDPEWARDNVKIPFPTTYVAGNGVGRDYEDLRLMSSCRHFILANSSFSWWGAWLAANPDKIVLAPKRWFTDPAIDTRELTPPGWLRI